MDHLVPTELRTDRLILTPLTESDAPEMVGVLADRSLYEFTGGEPPDLASLRTRYRAQAAGSTRHGETWLNWIVRTGQDLVPVGFVQATLTGTVADVAWVIGVPWQRRGIATEATAAMCRWLAEAGVARLTAHIHPRHVASAKVAATIGLIRTGEVDADGEEVWSS